MEAKNIQEMNFYSKSKCNIYFVMITKWTCIIRNRPAQISGTRRLLYAMWVSSRNVQYKKRLHKLRYVQCTLFFLRNQRTPRNSWRRCSSPPAMQISYRTPTATFLVILRWYTGAARQEIRRMELLARRMMRCPTTNLSRVMMQERVLTTIIHTVSQNNYTNQYQARCIYM